MECHKTLRCCSHLMKQMQPGNARGVSTLGNFRWGIGAFERLYGDVMMTITSSFVQYCYIKHFWPNQLKQIYVVGWCGDQRNRDDSSAWKESKKVVFAKHLYWLILLKRYLNLPKHSPKTPNQRSEYFGVSLLSRVHLMWNIIISSRFGRTTISKVLWWLRESKSKNGLRSSELR